MELRSVHERYKPCTIYPDPIAAFFLTFYFMLGTIIYNTDNDRVFNCINFFWLEGYIQLLIYNHFWRLRGSFLVPGIESELAVYKACTLPTISSLGLPQLHLNRYPASQDKALWTSGDCKSLFRGDRTRKVLVT